MFKISQQMLRYFYKKKKNVCVREFDNIVVRKSDVSPINGENGMNIEHHNLT